MGPERETLTVARVEKSGAMHMHTVRMKTHALMPFIFMRVVAWRQNRERTVKALRGRNASEHEPMRA